MFSYLITYILPDLDDGRDKLLQEAIHLRERGPPVVDEIDEETFDVRAIVILIASPHTYLYIYVYIYV